MKQKEIHTRLDTYLILNHLDLDRSQNDQMNSKELRGFIIMGI